MAKKTHTAKSNTKSAAKPKPASTRKDATAKKETGAAKSRKAASATPSAKGEKPAGVTKSAKSAKPAKSTKAKTTRSSAGNTTLIKQIDAILKSFDTPALEFLKRQAEVLKSNAEFEETRRETIAALERFKASGGRAVKEYAPDSVDIERKDSDFFNITVRGSRVFFNLEEMRALTRISHASESAADASRRLYRWFSKERKDFLNDTGIGGSADPALPRLYTIIVENYKVKS